VRPLAEIFYERKFGLDENVSELVGLTWQVNDKLAFDVAYRQPLPSGAIAKQG
jgi:hypothetical protein